MRKLTTMLAAAICASASPAIGQQSIDGTYIDSGGYTEITVAPCGSERCGKITRIIMRKPGASGLDEHNDDPTLRDRPILGLTILEGLRWRRGAWRGEVYNPEDGGMYRSVVRPGRNGTLEVEGCVAFICRKRIWTPAG